jgi:hypothetical protein
MRRPSSIGHAKTRLAALAETIERGLRAALRVGIVALTLVCGCTVDLDFCPVADDETVALYLFDEGTGTTLQNTAPTDAPDGYINNSAVTREPGPCGGALSIPASSPIPGIGQSSSSTDAYAVLPDAALWDLQAGSVELWVRFDPLPEPGRHGILLREAQWEDSPGHFQVLRLYEDGRTTIAARVQDGDETTFEQRFCSSLGLEDGVWHHIAVSFGGGQPITICIDGEPVDRASEIALKGSACGMDTPGSIGGNDEPWVIGADTSNSQASSDAPAYGGLGGAIASLRISETRRGCGGDAR